MKSDPGRLLQHFFNDIKKKIIIKCRTFHAEMFFILNDIPCTNFSEVNVELIEELKAMAFFGLRYCKPKLFF